MDFYKNKIKKIIGPSITVLTLIALFGVVFLQLGWSVRDGRFYSELSLVSILAIQMRFYWFESTEDAILGSEDIRLARELYDDRVEKEKININELDICLKEMDKENYENSLKKTIGFSTPEKIGQKKYNKLIKKAHKIANKIPKLKSSDILTRSTNIILYDSKNYQNKDKITYQTVAGITSVVITLVITAIAFQQILLSWENLFRYLMYAWSVLTSTAMTIGQASRTTRKNTLEHLSRLQMIVDKFCIWRDNQKWTSSEEQATMSQD